MSGGVVFSFDLQAPAITSAAGASFTIGKAGSSAVTTIGYPTPVITVNGKLPGGITFVDNGDGRATLAGTPAPGTGGPYPLIITASNGAAPDVTQGFLLTVIPRERTTMTEVSSKNPVPPGYPVRFTAMVTYYTRLYGVPRGSIQFLDGAKLLGRVPMVSAQASFRTSSLTAGPHTIKAVYSGDGNFKSSTATVVQTIGP